MAHWQLQHRRILGLAAPLLSLLLVQSAFGFPFRQTRADLSPRMVYHNVVSLVGTVLTRSRDIVDDLELLYELRQLTTGASQAERSSVPVSLSSPPSSSAQEKVCDYPVIPGPRGAEYRCLPSGRGGSRFSSVHRC
jgi:hypothetical protein